MWRNCATAHPASEQPRKVFAPHPTSLRPTRDPTLRASLLLSLPFAHFFATLPGGARRSTSKPKTQRTRSYMGHKRCSCETKTKLWSQSWFCRSMAASALRAAWLIPAPFRVLPFFAAERPANKAGGEPKRSSSLTTKLAIHFHTALSTDGRCTAECEAVMGSHRCLNTFCHLLGPKVKQVQDPRVYVNISLSKYIS